MKTIRSLQTMKTELQQSQNLSVGFVPTMGYLHEGHLSLVEQAKRENDIVIMSIFVNPLQFGPNEDFERYPRDEKHDTNAAQQAGVDLLFLPSVQEMYPEQMGLTINVCKGADVLCGSSRPGHFDGVATVLAKFFHLIAPNRTYFGLKDAQQFAIVNTLISHLNFPIQLIGLPTVREKDGLAKSSRNVYLSEEERKEAANLYQCLVQGQQLLRDGMKHSHTIIQKVKDCITSRTSAKIDYVELLSYPDLKPVELIEEQIILAVAVQYKHARLIDNIILSPEGKQIETIIK